MNDFNNYYILIIIDLLYTFEHLKWDKNPQKKRFKVRRNQVYVYFGWSCELHGLVRPTALTATDYELCSCCF